MHQQQLSPEHLEEFRLSVEGDVTALAARRRRPEDIRRLRDLLTEASGCLENPRPDAMAFIRVDIELHITLAEITTNPAFVAVVKMVHQTIMGFYENFTYRRTAVLEENYRDLCAIVAAVESGQADRARRLARRHVRRFNRHLQADEAQGGAQSAST
jgi:DNA-binding FadR family transcriptional regulator